MSTSSTEIDRLALRIGALRSARRRRSIRDGAWAAERLRLDGIVLDRSDARFAHDAVVRFGHALRIARVRRPWRGQPDEALVAGSPKRSWFWRAVAAALVLATIALILFIARPQTGHDDNVVGAVTGGGGGVPAASPLRGRSDGVLVAVPVTAASPGPAPTGTFEPREDRIGTGGGGSTGAGSSGSGGGTPARTAAPTPAPNVMRLSGRVIDSRTGDGLPGVCIVIGATNCTRSPITDQLGMWTVDLNLGQVLSWNIKFVKTDYVQQEINVPSRPGTFTVETVTLLSFR